jgi:hypothetical protein
MTTDRGDQPAGQQSRRSPAQPAQEEEGQPRSRQEGREERRFSEKRRISKHGASLRRIYPDAVRKRAASGRKKRRRPQGGQGGRLPFDTPPAPS